MNSIQYVILFYSIKDCIYAVYKFTSSKIIKDTQIVYHNIEKYNTDFTFGNIFKVP